MSTPSVIELQRGSRITSKTECYTVDKELGEGGFGTVYLVKAGNKTYALKLTKMWTFMPQERVEYAKRFKQEF